MRVTPCPSPTGRNDERLFIFKAPRGVDPELALDAALRRASDKAKGRKGYDEDPDRSLGELRQKLEALLQQCLPEDRYQSAVDVLNEHLPGGTVYGEGTEDADPDAAAESLWAKYPDHAQDVRKYLADRGFSDDDIAAAIGEMPKNAIEDRRGGRDRRGAMDRQHMAADSFNALFPDAARIKSTNSFR
jgi:hypothetical protein